ncbi:ABC transporter ATP-binding protein [Capnocytophaga canis]|uniref:ABC transporter ATP-binding protein n=1 Tax=Capnocytophaga canis TaxID=1848903 RepID=UPI0037D26998
MIQVKNLHKSFNGIPVLKGISTTFEKGKTNLIIGQSGSGKTVFLKSLLGLFTPDEGDIIYDGVSYAEMKRNERTKLRQKMGMVFQGSALFDSMTVLENVTFPLQMFSSKTPEEIRERADMVLNRVKLVNAEHKLPSEISGGMQKRVAIARAIVNRPNFLFCDEPNSGLDPKTAIVIDNLIQEITEEFNITTIINTHDMNSVMEIGAKIIFLKNGYKEWEGSKDTIFITDNEAVTDFVYSSELFKKVRRAYLDEHSTTLK